MVQIIKDRQEIEKDFLINVSQVKGIIHCETDDFYRYADSYKLAMELSVDSPESVHAQVETAMAEIKKQGIDKIAAVILSISFKPSYPLTMEEINVVSFFDDDVKKKISVQERDNISNNHCVSLFVFV